jgi:hypothetical protein
MSTIKIEDVAFVRFRAPDLTEMQTFLSEFGLDVVEATGQRIVARGSGPSPVAPSSASAFGPPASMISSDWPRPRVSAPSPSTRPAAAAGWC